MKVIEGTAKKDEIEKYERRPEIFSSTSVADNEDDKSKNGSRFRGRMPLLFKKAVYNTLDQIRFSR